MSDTANLPVPTWRYCTFWRRFWAAVIDGLPCYPLVLLDERLRSDESGPLLLAVWFLFLQLGFYAYSVVMHGHYGQTIGKMITGVAVRDLSEQKLTFGQALLRDGVAIVLAGLGVIVGLPRVLEGQRPFVGPGADGWWVLLGWAGLAWFVAELVTMLTNRKRRAIHDLIAGSVVVRVR